MEFSQEEKDRIVAEEKLRMETRKDYLQEHFGGMGCHGHRWGGRWHGCHGRCGGFIRALILILVVAALFHFWRGSSSCGPCGYNAPAQYQSQTAPAPQIPTKN